MNLSLRRSTSALLASSLLLTIGRGATLPFMTIYLSRQYSLSVDLIGYAMTIALTIGVVFSLGFGILADKFDKKRYMLLAITAFASGFIAIPLVDSQKGRLMLCMTNSVPSGGPTVQPILSMV